MVEQQMRNWELGRSQRPGTGGRSPVPCAEFVTITNNVGGGGGEIAKLLGERLNWPVFDRQILKEMAADDEVRTRLYEAMDERKLGFFEEAIRSFTQGEYRRDDYFRNLTRTLLCLSCQGPAVFVGRAADLILSESKGLRVKVVSSFDQRVRRFAEHAGISEKEATKQVKRIDEDRAYFIWTHFGVDVNEPTRFDLLINVERFSTNQSVQLVLSALTLRGIAT
jgi:cytidylate kinase